MAYVLMAFEFGQIWNCLRRRRCHFACSPRQASEEPGFGFNFGYQALKLDKCSARVVSHSLTELNQWPSQSKATRIRRFYLAFLVSSGCPH